MSTTITPELSHKNKYYISKHRYYELKHFCLQYPEWKYQMVTLGGVMRNANLIEDPTGETATKLADLKSKIALIRKLAMESDKDLASYIFKAVTEERTYENLKTFFDIPCSRDMYYDRYRKFFWLLDKER